MSGMVSQSLACRDWREKLRAGQTPIAELDLNQGRAERAVNIFNRLRLPDVQGTPSMNSAAGQWSRDIVAAVFGSVNDEGSRWIREFFILVPKKNSKTTTGAAIMVTALLMNERPRAEFLLIGPTQAIADTAFSQAVGFIQSDPGGELQKIFHITEHTKTIKHLGTGAFLKIKTFDTKVMTGSKPVGVLIDEIHELGKMAYAQRVLQQITGGIIANPEGFVFYITTQSDSPPTGVFKSKLQLARDVRDGKAIEATDFLPILYEFPIEMQADENQPWRDPEFWKLVLPNDGRSITVERLEGDYAKAQREGPEAFSIWASQHLNIQIGIALNHDGWAGARYWPKSVDQTLTKETLLERSEVVVAGLDGGGLDDLFGLALIGRERGTNRWLLWGRGWAQSDVLELRKEIADSLRQFGEDGDLVICSESEPLRDVFEICDLLEEVHQLNLFPQEDAIGVDPEGITAVVDELEAREIREPMVRAVLQGYRLSSAVWGMERKLKDGTLLHADQPLMTFCVGNAKAEQRGNAVHVTKQVAGKAKIDPLIAAFNAFYLMSLNPKASNDGNMNDYFDSLAAA